MQAGSLRYTENEGKDADVTPEHAGRDACATPEDDGALRCSMANLQGVGIDLP